MAEQFSEVTLDYSTHGPTRCGRIEQYFANNEMDSMANLVAESFRKPTLSLASTVVLIPVAVEQDASLIEHSLDEYAKQQGSDPFSVCLLLNGNLRTPESAFTTAVEQVYKAQRTYSGHLDIRYATAAYDTPLIGQIRKNLWDGALLLAHNEGAYETVGSEVTGISHDIDTHSIHPHYIRNVQRHHTKANLTAEASGRPESVTNLAHTMVSHHFPFDTHPNTAKGMYWFDVMYRRTKQLHGYEEGVTMPLTYYARQGGFSPNSRTYETEPFIRKATTSPTIEGTGMKTSARRYIDRFPTYGYAVWSNETFSENDPCRDNTEKRDATPEELGRHVRRHLAETLRYLTDFEASAVFSGEFGEAYNQITSEYELRMQSQIAATKLERRYRQNFALAERTLRSIGLPNIATKVAEKSHIRSRVDLEITAASQIVHRNNIHKWTYDTVM